MTKDRNRPSGQNPVAESGKFHRIDGPTTGTPPDPPSGGGFDRCPSSQQALRFAISLAAPLNAHLLRHAHRPVGLVPDATRDTKAGQ